MPSQEKATLKAVGNYVLVLLTLIPVWSQRQEECGPEEGTQFLLPALGQKKKMNLSATF